MTNTITIHGYSEQTMRDARVIDALAGGYDVPTDVIQDFNRRHDVGDLVETAPGCWKPSCFIRRAYINTPLAPRWW